ncbi:hypothetical protein JD844_005342 [Phrynosoma platyrhinos]|uniref:Transmembrane protein 35B n=1 Tax=Phrynosoma platyrhinos TaxID=52577 RepID=A0ABQ7TMX9_PHRPL|nr:hypothetical protein JD844_005342 [Phrynosoma platyrhinos]
MCQASLGRSFPLYPQYLNKGWSQDVACRCQQSKMAASGKPYMMIRYQIHNAEGWKNAKLPSLPFLVPPVQPKGSKTQNAHSSNAKSRNGLGGKCTYLHFSSPVQLAVKPSPCKPWRDFPPGSKQHGLLAAPRPLVNPTVQNLMVNGMTCVPSLLPQIRRPKTEIHVYVPNGKENTDVESLDEGFLEETENRPSTLKFGYKPDPVRYLEIVGWIEVVAGFLLAFGPQLLQEISNFVLTIVMIGAIYTLLVLKEPIATCAPATVCLGLLLLLNIRGRGRSSKSKFE